MRLYRPILANTAVTKRRVVLREIIGGHKIFGNKVKHTNRGPHTESSAAVDQLLVWPRSMSPG